MRTPTSMRLPLWLAALVAGLGFAGVPGGAVAAEDQAWRRWSESVLERGFSDPTRLAQEAATRYAGAVAAGDLAARVHAVFEQQVGAVVAGEFDNETITRRVDDTLAAVRAAGRNDLLFDIVDAKIWTLAANEKLPEMAPLLVEQERLARALGDRARLAPALSNQAVAASLAGDLPESLRLNQEALDAAVDDLHRGDILLNMADSAEWVLTDPQARQTRIGWAERALALVDPDRYPYAGIHAYHIIAKHLEREDPAKALGARHRALDLALHVGNPATVAAMRVGLAEALLRVGRSDAAADEVRRALPTLGSEDFRRSAYAVLAQAHAGKAEPAQALAWLRRAEQLVQGPLQGWPRAREDLEQLRAQVFARLGQWQNAYAALERYQRLSDQGLRQAGTRQAQLMEARYDAQLRAQENVLLRAQQASLEERRQLLTAGLGLAFLALLGFAALAVRQTRQKHILERLGQGIAQRNEALQSMHASRTRLLAAACHDLRQPAHALGLLADLAAGAAEERERAAKLEGIRRCSRSLTDMLGMLMDLTRLEGGIFQPAHAPVSVGELLREVELQFAADAARKGLQLEVQPGTLWVRSDRHLLRRIVFNLVSNAVRYTRSGRITVAARVQPEGSVRLEVRDTGPGIPNERLADVFSEYVRLDRKVEDGLGIGLPIVQRAAALLGHPLHVQSEPGVGSCFGIDLPQSPPGSLGQPTLLGLAPVGGHRLLLLLDDDEESLAASASLMRQWGFDVVTASGAEAGVAAVAASGRTPELLVTDLHIEGELDGLDAVEAMRLRWPGMRALLVTGDLEATVVSRAAALAVPVGYKPLSPGRLLARIEDALAQPLEPG